MPTHPDCAAGCGKPVLLNQGHVFQKVEGWVKLRAKGGANAIALRKPLQTYMHETCMHFVQKGLSPGQIAMMMSPDNPDPDLFGGSLDDGTTQTS